MTNVDKLLYSEKFDVGNREFFLNNEVSSKNLEEIILGIKAINRHDDYYENEMKDYECKPIKIYVDSYGGACYDGMGLVNIIEYSKTPVHTYCFSKAMSMGLSIYAAGHKRFAHKRATFMHHQLSTSLGGTLTDLIESVEQCKVLQNMMDEMLVEKTRIKTEEILKYRERKVDWYFNGSEAYKLGLVDELL